MSRLIAKGFIFLFLQTYICWSNQVLKENDKMNYCTRRSFLFLLGTFLGTHFIWYQHPFLMKEELSPSRSQSYLRKKSSRTIRFPSSSSPFSSSSLWTRTSSCPSLSSPWNLSSSPSSSYRRHHACQEQLQQHQGLLLQLLLDLLHQNHLANDQMGFVIIKMKDFKISISPMFINKLLHPFLF